MLRLTLITLVVSGSFGCSTNTESAKETGKSRKELLRDFPFKNEIIDEEITSTIQLNLERVIKRAESFNKVAIFYVDEQKKLIELEGSWQDGSAAIKHANELWRDIKVEMTFVIYPSYAQDAVTSETKQLWVIEVEHKSVSRSCRLFFDTPTPTELPKFDC